jgi:hypothetical protein
MDNQRDLRQLSDDQIRNLSDQECEEVFRSMGELLYEDPQQHFDVRSGDVFKAQTVKGGYQYVVALRVFSGYMFYGHGDKVRKVPVSDFIRTIESGDLEFIKVSQLDREKLSLAVIGLDAIANRRKAEQSIDVMADNAADFIKKSHQAMGIIQ